MKAYITLEYRSPYGAVNSLWASARQHGYIPDTIYLLTPKPDGDHARVHIAMLSAVHEGLGRKPHVEPVMIKPDDLAETRKVVQAIIKARKREGHEVAVDITPGRTIAKLGVFYACEKERPDHMFYLDISDYDYRDVPYVRIPVRMQKSRDVLKEVMQDG